MTHKDIAGQAIALVTPAIEELFKQTVRKELHIVIMDPRLKPWETSFDDAILHEHTIRNTEIWDKPFDEFARKKAKQAWRDNRANILNQTLHPSSLSEDDLPFYGSFVYGNLVVACSGVEQWFDMLISGWIALAFEQLAVHERS